VCSASNATGLEIRIFPANVYDPHEAVQCLCELEVTESVSLFLRTNANNPSPSVNITFVNSLLTPEMRVELQPGMYAFIATPGSNLDSIDTTEWIITVSLHQGWWTIHFLFVLVAQCVNISVKCMFYECKSIINKTSVYTVSLSSFACVSFLTRQLKSTNVCQSIIHVYPDVLAICGGDPGFDLGAGVDYDNGGNRWKCWRLK